MTGTVLILTEKRDTTADLVVLELESREAPFVRIDPAEFPRTLGPTGELDRNGWTGTLDTGSRSVRLADVRAVYYRRPGIPAVPPGLTSAETQWATREAIGGTYGLLGALDCRWVNHPARNATAGYKPLQLAVAVECGLAVPRSLITHDPERARRFADQVGRLICKPIISGAIVEEGVGKGAFASLVDPADLDDSVRTTAHLFQQWVEKAHEVRLTVVGEELFAAEIHAGSSAARIDWRSDYGALTYQIAQVPEPVAAGVQAFVSRLGLRYGAFDFVVRPDGTWVFLEVNPNGQWGWIQAHTGLPIAAALADLLQQGASTHARTRPATTHR